MTFRTHSFAYAHSLGTSYRHAAEPMNWEEGHFFFSLMQVVREVPYRFGSMIPVSGPIEKHHLTMMKTRVKLQEQIMLGGEKGWMPL